MANGTPGTGRRSRAVRDLGLSIFRVTIVIIFSNRLLGDKSGGSDMDVSELAKELTVFCKQRAVNRQRTPHRAILLLVMAVLAGGGPGPDKGKFWSIE